MKNGTYYGIDFGTTNTSVYLYRYQAGFGAVETGFGTHGRDEYPFASCIAIPTNSNNKDYSKFLFGRSVKEKINEYANHYRIVTSFKSLLGTDEKVVVNDLCYSGVELTAAFLEHVKSTVERAGGDLQEAIFSVPVDFSAKARKDLRNAAELIGIQVRGFVSESSAAYISHAATKKSFSKVLVIDFGGGTLDLSVLRLQENRIYEDAVHGVKFGGDDVDQELAKRIMPKIYPEISFESLDAKRKDRLMNEIERMKIDFAQYDDYTITLGDGTRPVDIDYDTFSDIVTPLVTTQVLHALEKIMEKANIRPASVDAVLLAGGSSGLRPFADLILSLFGKDKIIFDKDGDRYQWIVAKGAAITSAMGCDFRLADDFCVLLSDGTTYPILCRDKNKVGDKSETLSLSLTDDALDAHFIFTDSTGENRYAMVSVKTKGYYNEILELQVSLTPEQIAVVTIQDKDMGEYMERCEINKLCFYYDLQEL